MLGILWAFWISRLLSFIQFWKIVIVSSNISNALFYLSFWYSVYMYMRLMVSHSFWMHYFFPPFFSPCASSWLLYFYFFPFFFLVFCLFRASPMAYGDSQARGWIRAVAAGLHHSHSHSSCGIRAMSVICTATHINVGSLIHWARPGIKPAFSWILVSFVNHWAMTGTPVSLHF